MLKSETLAAGDLPLVVSFDDDRGRQSQERGRIGEDFHDAGSAFDLLVESFDRIVRPDLLPMGFGETQKTPGRRAARERTIPTPASESAPPHLRWLWSRFWIGGRCIRCCDFGPLVAAGTPLDAPCRIINTKA